MTRSLKCVKSVSGKHGSVEVAWKLDRMPYKKSDMDLAWSSMINMVNMNLLFFCFARLPGHAKRSTQYLSSFCWLL